MSAEQVKAVGSELKELQISVTDPIVIVVFGKTGVGKTTIANEIGFRLGASILSSDVFRRKRFSGIQYEPWHSEIALEDMIDGAQKLFDEGARSVVLDATFSKSDYRQKATELARKNRKRIIWIEVICDKKNASRGNIDGKYVLRDADDSTDIKARIVIDNSARDQNKEKQIRTLVDNFVLPK